MTATEAKIHVREAITAKMRASLWEYAGVLLIEDVDRAEFYRRLNDYADQVSEWAVSSVNQIWAKIDQASGTVH